MKYKQIITGYIVSIGENIGGAEITEDEYNDILAVIHDKPKATETTDYRLRKDLTWEEYEVEPTPAPEPTTEDKAEAYDILMGDVVCAGMTPQEKARQLRPLIEKPLFSLTKLNGGK